MTFFKKRIGRLAFFVYFLIIHLLLFFTEIMMGSSNLFLLEFINIVAMSALFYVTALRLNDINVNVSFACVVSFLFSGISELILVSILFLLFLCAKSGNHSDKAPQHNLYRLSWIIGFVVAVMLFICLTHNRHVKEQYYRNRAYISVGLALSAKKKELVSEYYKKYGVLPDSKDILQNKKLVGNAVDDVKIGEGGRIMIYYNDKVQEKGGVIVLVPEVNKNLIEKWRCEKTNLSQKFLPAVLKKECAFES